MTTEQIELVMTELERWLGMPIRLAGCDGEYQSIDIVSPTGIPLVRMDVLLVNGGWTLGGMGLSSECWPNMRPLLQNMDAHGDGVLTAQGGQP